MAIQINGRKVIQLGTANIPVLKGDKGDIGQQGEQGIQGIPGYTPVKGIDYMTSEDKQQIADTVKADITPEITELKNGKVDKKQGYGLSQNDFTNELKDKLDNAGKQEDIDKLKAENEQQAEQINYLDKTLTRAEASGENINIKNSAEYPISNISIDTNIKQDTREGYNLCDISEFTTLVTNGGITFENVGNGGIKVSGTATNLVVAKVSKPINIIAGTKCYISGGISEDVSIDIRDSSNNTVGARSTILNANTEVVASRNIEGNLAIRVATGTTVNTTLYPFLSLEDKPYEQYGSMPSIEFPSEIKTPVGKQEVYVGNKNFVNFKKWYENKDILISNSSSITLNEITENSITFTPSSNDAFTNTYAMSSTNINENKAKYETWSGISLKENTKYTVSYEKNVSAIRFMLFFLDKDFNYLGLIDNIGNGQVITTPAKTKYITYRVGAVNSKDVSITVKNIQLEENTVATDYIEHQSQVQDLDVGELLGPIVDKEDGSYFENRYERYVFTGDEKIIKSSLTTLDRYVVYTNVENFVKGTGSKSNLCNYFKSGILSIGYMGTDSEDNGKQRAIFEYAEAGTSTLEEFKAKLKELYDNGTPVEIVYELATPTYTKITDEQQAQWNKIKKMHTYEGVTNIYTINDNGISPVINMKYVKSPKVVEENLQAQIDKLKNSIISMGGNV